jgi:hypothetical protein
MRLYLSWLGINIQDSTEAICDSESPDFAVIVLLQLALICVRESRP